MPTYDFRCPNCNHTETIFRGLKDNVEVPCINCGHTMSKLVGTPDFRFADPRGTCGKKATGYTKIRDS